VVVRTHALDLSVLDFSVVNPDGDASAPTLSDLSLLSSTVDSGDAVVLRYVGHDTGSGIASVSATFVNPSDTSTAASIGLMSPTEPELAAIGPASAVVPVPKAGGAYVLSSLNVTDRAGNLTVYGPGAVVTQPPGISPKPDVVDLSALALTIVSTGAADTTPPVLDAVTMSTSAIRHPGDEVLFSVDAHDVGSAVTGIYVYLQDAEGHYEFAQMLNCSYEHGVLGWWIRPVYPAGSWKVTHVALTDAMGNTGLYFPDGTAQDTAGHPIAGHVFTGSFTVVDGPPTEENLTIPPCDPISVDAAPNDVYATPGSSVTIRGAVHKGALRVQAPLVAVYSTVGRTTSLVGIVRGSSTGSFARTVTVGTSTSFRSRFLGSGRVPDAGATTSRASNVFVGTRQSVASGARSLSVRAGRAATLSAVVWPRRTSLAVTLQRKVGTSWRFVAAPRTVAGGVVTWRVPRPTSTTAYRWFLPYAAGHLPSTSSVITVRRG
jgi:hypothetical protein